MLTVQLPIKFLQALQLNPVCIDYWLAWISTYGEKIKEPFFIDWLNKSAKWNQAELEKIRQIYDWGKPYLQLISFGKLKKTTQKSKIKDTSIDVQARRVLTYLNLKTGVTYGKIKIEPALKPIKEILRQGYSPYDCKAVIDKKYDEWHGTDFEKYLRPSTLFNSEKFDTYLNQPVTHGRKPASGNFESISDAVSQAIDLNHKMGPNPE